MRGVWLSHSVGVGLASLIALASSGAAAAAPAMSERQQSLCLSAPSVSASGSPRGLLELRDIGSEEWDTVNELPFAVSPGGFLAAIKLRQADLEADGYTSEWCLIDLRKRQVQARSAGDAGEPIPVRLLGQPATENGLFSDPPPIWSPDGTWFAYLRKQGADVQVWRSWAADGRQEQFTFASSPVSAFAINPATGVILLEFMDAPAAAPLGDPMTTPEADQGFLFDDRFWPLIGVRPRLRKTDLKARIATWSPGSRTEVPATDAQRVTFYQLVGKDSSGGRLKVLEVASKWGAVRATSVEAEPPQTNEVRPDGAQRIVQLEFLDPSAAAHLCTHPECRGPIAESWWNPNASEVLFRRREGANFGVNAIYGWDTASGRVRLVLRTTDRLFACRAAKGQTICFHEGPNQPRRLVGVDLSTAKLASLYDPNPGFAAAAKGRVTRLEWRIPGFGTAEKPAESYGYLVLPAVSVTKPPLVVVQYRAHRFLRGGTGDEYPVHALAAAGFAVLVVEHPGELPTYDVSRSVDLTLASVDAGIKAVAKLGAVDTTKTAITGFSNGTMTIWRALAQGRTYEAAIMTHCCFDPLTFYLVGSTKQSDFESWGLTDPMDPRSNAVWQGISLALNAKRINTPILVNIDEDEALGAVQTETALRRAGKPFEMHVFPEAHHYKASPRQRLATYIRNVDWLRFWVLGVEDCDPAKQAQYARWRKLRELKVATAVPRP